MTGRCTVSELYSRIVKAVRGKGSRFPCVTSHMLLSTKTFDNKGGERRLFFWSLSTVHLHQMLILFYLPLGQQTCCKESKIYMILLLRDKVSPVLIEIMHFRPFHIASIRYGTIPFCLSTLAWVS